MPDYKVKTKPKKGAPLSAAQKQAVASGTYKRLEPTSGKKVKDFLNKKMDFSVGESKYGGTKTPVKTALKSFVGKGQSGAGGSGYCPTGTKNCKTAYSKSSKKTK
jgi:hypothetical protein